MTIQHKFDLGQYVYLIKQDRVQKLRIITIGLTILEDKSIRVFYSLENIGGNYGDSMLFASKEELLKSL